VVQASRRQKETISLQSNLKWQWQLSNRV
jgi:hypothetical protein